MRRAPAANPPARPPVLRLRDLPHPDYDGGGIVNLMSSVIRSRGGRCVHTPLRVAPAATLRPYKKVVLLLLDGLGANQLRTLLRGRRPLMFFNRHPWDVITTACPATTASVVTTLATGSTPTEHGILGWHLHLPDLGMDGTILPFVTRTGSPIAPPEFDLHRYLALPAPLATTAGRRVLISIGDLPQSRTSLAQPWWHERRSFESLDGLLRQLKNYARTSPRRPSFAYAYWPHYDSLCHAHGPHGRIPAAHLREIDAFLARLERALAGTGTLLLVTADHGHMRVRTPLDLTPLYPLLTTLPSGDARMAQCFVRPTRVKEFLDQLRRPPFAGVCACASQSEVLRSGILGPGTPHPALLNRMGDYVLFAAPGHAFLYPAAQSRHNRPMPGAHGGLSDDELLVPLFTIRP